MEGLKRIDDVLRNVEDWQDFEKRFLYGSGFSETYIRNFRSGIKIFFEWTRSLNKQEKMLHPAEITPAHIELFFDYVKKKRSMQTAVVRNYQLKTFFRKLTEKYVFLESPFERVDERLKKKLAGPRTGNRRVRYLSYSEMQILFEYLKNWRDKEDRGKQSRFFYSYALGQFLFVHGFRISEALQLKGKDTKQFGDHYVAYFIGKGNIASEQKISLKSLEIVKQNFRKVQHRQPEEEDFLFPVTPLRYYKRIKNKDRRATIGDALYLFKEVEAEINEIKLFGWQINLGTHHFRHSLGQYLSRERGLPVQQIAKILRHKDVNVTASTYTEPESLAPEEYFE